MNAGRCPVCQSQLLNSKELNVERFINCPRCGEFIASIQVIVILEGEIQKGLRWAITSHAIRSMNAPGEKPYRLTPEWLTSVWVSKKLPNPQKQADSFVEYLGMSGIPGNWVRCRSQGLTGLLGTGDDPTLGKTGGLNFILDRLKTKGLIEQERHQSTDGKIGYRLTFDLGAF